MFSVMSSFPFNAGLAELAGKYLSLQSPTPSKADAAQEKPDLADSLLDTPDEATQDIPELPAKKMRVQCSPDPVRVLDFDDASANSSPSQCPFEAGVSQYMVRYGDLCNTQTLEDAFDACVRTIEHYIPKYSPSQIDRSISLAGYVLS